MPPPRLDRALLMGVGQFVNPYGNFKNSQMLCENHNNSKALTWPRALGSRQLKMQQCSHLPLFTCNASCVYVMCILYTQKKLYV